MSDTPGAVERWLLTHCPVCGQPCDEADCHCLPDCPDLDVATQVYTFARAHDAEDARLRKQAVDALKVAHECCDDFGTPCTPENCQIAAAIDALEVR